MTEEIIRGTGSDVSLRKSTGGVFDDVEHLAKAISKLGTQFNIVNPGGAVGSNLPLLHSGGVSFVFADLEHETYPIPGKKEVGLGKTLLDRISSAAGVRWNPHLCGKVDDGSDANYVEYQAAGTVLQLDGTERMITGQKRIDLRAEKGMDPSTWGAEAQEINRSAVDNKRDPWPRILQARQHILSLAETKAKNRAIRSLGVRTAYDVKDLEKGFAVVRLQFTGRSDDPEIERMVAGKIADRALSSSSMLYGGEGQRRELQAPPRVSRVPRIATPAAVEEDEPETKGAEPANAKVPAAKSEDKDPGPGNGSQSEAPKRVEPPADPMLICGKKDAETKKFPRKPCSAFSADELRKKIEYAEAKRTTWDPEWAEKNEEELTMMKAWLAYKEFDPRQGTLPTGEDGDEVRL